MTNSGDSHPFNPTDHLINLKGKTYLEVKFRIQWLRAAWPDAVILTELMREAESYALFRAQVTIPTGGSATGWGSETAGDFPDFLEKAETKAIGRALAALGYGTQFAAELDEDAERAPADRPVTPRSQAAARAGTANSATGPQCPTHHKGREKDGHWFCPTKLADGSWCPWKGETPPPPLPSREDIDRAGTQPLTAQTDGMEAPAARPEERAERLQYALNDVQQAPLEDLGMVKAALRQQRWSLAEAAEIGQAFIARERGAQQQASMEVKA